MLSPFVLVILVFSFTLPLSVKALQLTINSIVVSGIPVDVVWSLDNGDPFSFGLMQRSLENDAVIDVTPVENTQEVLTGTVSVTFTTPGQVLLAGIKELSLDPGQPFNQFAPGHQVTVKNSNSSSLPTKPITPGPNSTTTETVTSTTSTFTTTTISQNNTSTSFNSTSSTTSSSTSQTSSHSFSSSSLPTTSPSVFPTPHSLPSSTSSSDTQPTSSSTSQSSIPAASSSALSDSGSSGATSINKRALFLSMAVIGGVILCLLIIYLIIRCQRSATRQRLTIFQSRLNRQPSNARSITSFYSPDEEDGMSQRSFARLSSGDIRDDSEEMAVAGFTGVGRRGVTAPWPHDTEPQLQTPTFGTPPARDEASKERFHLAANLERSRGQTRDSWSDILSEEPLPMYIESTYRRN